MNVVFLNMLILNTGVKKACLNLRSKFKHAFFEGVYVNPACLNAALKFKHAGFG